MITATWITWNLVWTGAVNGLVTGLLALGLVLVYRSTRVINFAVADLGLPASFLFALCVLNYGWPYWVALPAILVVGAAWGAIIEVAVIRRLFHAPRVIVLVATVGVAQLGQAITFAYPDINGGVSKPFPTALAGRWEPFLDIVVTGPQVVVLVAVPCLAAALGWTMNRTRFGRHVQAVASNADLARLSGVSPKAVASGVWVIAGVLATTSSVLLLSLGTSTAGLEQGQASAGPGTLLRALTAALMARMTSFPRAVLAGLAIGVGEAVIRYNRPTETGLSEFVMFVVVLAAVAIVARRAEGGGESFTFAPRAEAVPEALRTTWWAGRLPRLVAVVAVAVAAVLPLVFTEASRQFNYSTVLAFAVCAMSVTMLTGWAGQLSLAQMGFAGLGAFSAASIRNGVGWPFVVCLLAGAVIAAGAAFVIGLGALRVRGLLLSVSTLAFAVAASQYLFRRPFLSGSESSSVPFHRGHLGPIDLADRQRNYYWFCLVVLVLVTLLAARIRHSGVGRTVVAVRENERAAAAMTVEPIRTKLLTFTLAGFVAGLGGGLLGGVAAQVPLSERFFLPADSLRLVAMTVIGGLGTLAGPIIGAAWVVGLPFLFPDNELVPLFTSSLGLLILLLYLPGGFVQIGQIIRRGVFRRALARRPAAESKQSTSAPAAIREHRATSAPPGSSPPASAPAAVLRTRSLTVRFGGLIAVDSVDLAVEPGQIVGLIGTNGAGKSTVLNAIGGFLPATGRVELLGRDVSSLRASARARRGLGRTFQSATLFPELTVRETVYVALEARRRTTLLTTVLSLPHARRAERSSRQDAAEIIDFLGLGRYADRFVAELSTGTRRIVELATVVAVAPRVICLDEPTAGVAQREAEAFGPLISQLRRELGASLIIVEHDMPLIMSISDHVICLEAGHVIAEGTPAAVRTDPHVVASYLGTDERAIDRSDAVAPTG